MKQASRSRAGGRARQPLDGRSQAAHTPPSRAWRACRTGHHPHCPFKGHRPPKAAPSTVFLQGDVPREQPLSRLACSDILTAHCLVFSAKYPFQMHLKGTLKYTPCNSVCDRFSPLSSVGRSCVLLHAQTYGPGAALSLVHDRTQPPQPLGLGPHPATAFSISRQGGPPACPHWGLRPIHVQPNKRKRARLLTWAGLTCPSPAASGLSTHSGSGLSTCSSCAAHVPWSSRSVPGHRVGGRHVGGCGQCLPEAASPRAGQPSRVCLSPGSPPTIRLWLTSPHLSPPVRVLSQLQTEIHNRTHNPTTLPRCVHLFTCKVTQGLFSAVTFKFTCSRFFAGNSK